MPHPVHGRGVHPALRLGAVAAVRVEQHLGGVVVREKPRSHGVYAQFRIKVSGKMRGKGLGKIAHPGLGRGIGDMPADSRERADGAEIDDRSAAGVVEHLRAVREARPETAAEEVQRHRIELRLCVEIEKALLVRVIRALDVAARRVDHHVDPAEIAHHVFGVLPDLVLTERIYLVGLYLHTRVTGFGNQGVQPFPAGVVTRRHVGPGIGHRPYGGPAKGPGSTGHNGGFPLQTEQRMNIHLVLLTG